MEMNIILEGFPFPPSVNESYMVTRSFGGKGGLAATDVLKRFKQDVLAYKYRHTIPLLQCYAMAQQWLDDGYVLKAKVHLMFPKSELFTKGKDAKSKFKRTDSNNRVKAALDGVSTCLDIDDSYIFDDGTEKMQQMEDKPRCAIIVLSKTKVRDWTDLMVDHPRLTRQDFSV